jgi:hypothetical protein
MVGLCCLAALAGCGRHPAPGRPVRDYPAGLGPLRIVYAAVSVPYHGDDLRTGRYDLFEYDLPSARTRRLTGPDVPGQTRFGNTISEKVRLAPNGRRLVFEANLPNEPRDLDQTSGVNVLGVHLWHMDLATGKIGRFDIAGDDAGFPNQGWSPDGRYYAALRQDGPQLPGGAQADWSLRAWETRTWRSIPITPGLAPEKDGWFRPRIASGGEPSPSPDRTKVARIRRAGSGNWRLEVRDARSGELLVSSPGPEYAYRVLWTRDGRRLVYLAQQTAELPAQRNTWTISVVDAGTGKRLHFQTLAVRAVAWDAFQDARWSRDGDRLIGLNREEDGYDFVMWDAKTYTVRTLPGPRNLPPRESMTAWVSGVDWAEMPSPGPSVGKEAFGKPGKRAGARGDTARAPANS